MVEEQPAPPLDDAASQERFAKLKSRLARGVQWLPLALAIGLVLALWIAYAAAHQWLCDDAFISFRYSRNLMQGRGLVFNVGEYVEGYTNFLWVLELAAIWKLFGVIPEHASIALGWLYSAATLWLTARLSYRTPFTTLRWLAVVGALFLLAINRNFAVWTTSGLETRQFTFFTVLAIGAMHLRPRDDVRPYVIASLAWTLAELTRPEATLLFGAGGLWLLAQDAIDKQLRVRRLLAYATPFALLVTAHYLFRHAYYGDWFPNTYYAKDVRAWPQAGFNFLTVGVIEGGLQVVVPIALLGLYARLRYTNDALHTLSLLCMGLHAIYMVRIGGDHFEFRPLDFYWPLLAIATMDGLLMLQRIVSRLVQRYGPQHQRLASWFVAGAAALTVCVYGTVLQLAQLTLTHDLKSRTETFRLKSEVTRAAFPAAFLLPGMDTLTAIFNDADRFTSRHSVATRFAEHKAFWKEQLNLFGPYLEVTPVDFPPDAVMTIGQIGVIGYAFADLTLVDNLGLTDRTVARNPTTTPNSQRQLAHDRSPPPGYLEKRGVNLQVLPAAKAFGTASPFALRLREDLWMPLLSHKEAWLKEAFASRGLWWRHLQNSLTDNRVWADGVELSPRVELAFFEATPLQGWQLHGDAMRGQPRAAVPRLQGVISGLVGARALNTFGSTNGDAAKGNAISPVFVPQARDRLVFVVGGGRSAEVGVELQVDGLFVKTWRGENTEDLGLVVYDLSDYAGRSCTIRIFDDSAGAWGHVIADHFMLMQPR